MTLNELRYIVAVARERHFGRAAEACFVSQPTLSVAVRKLEDELEVSLFERGSTEIKVTPVGEKIISQAQRVLEEAGMIRRFASHGKDQLKGPLRVGAIYTIGPYLFPHLVPIMADQAKNMPLIIEENFTSVLSEQLKQGDLDVIIISLPFDEPGICTLPLYDEPFVVLLPLSHPLSNTASVDISRLAEEDVLLLGAGHCFRDQVLQACPECLKPTDLSDNNIQKNLQGSSLETIRYMVASGVGVTILPCSAAGKDGLPGGLVSVKPMQGVIPKRRVALAWRKSFTRPAVIDVLHKAILDCDLACVEKVS